MKLYSLIIGNSWLAAIANREATASFAHRNPFSRKSGSAQAASDSLSDGTGSWL